jgi:Phage Single-stranded DNA-binding protein
MSSKKHRSIDRPGDPSLQPPAGEPWDSDQTADIDEFGGPSDSQQATPTEAPGVNGTGLEPRPTQRANPILARLLAAPGTPLTECATSLDLSRADHRAIAFNATAQATLEMPADGMVELDASHYLVHPYTDTDPDTGEVKDILRAVFIGKDGQTFATTSEVIVRRLADLLSMFENCRWQGTLRLRIEERTARRSRRTYHNLAIVATPE